MRMNRGLLVLCVGFLILLVLHSRKENSKIKKEIETLKTLNNELIKASNI